MPTKSRRPPKGAVLWGVVTWFPFLAIPFSVFFLEVRWQHEVFANDFEIHKLGKELRDSERRMAEYEEEEARLKTMDALEGMAMELQLVAPAPGQVETIGGENMAAGSSTQVLPSPAMAAEQPPPSEEGQPLVAREELDTP